MLHVTSSEATKQNDRSRTAPLREQQRQLHPHYGSASTFSPGDLSLAGRPSPATQLRQHFAGLQRTHGNQAVLRMLSHPTPEMQTKLKVNQPGDQYEQEADRVAEQVMRIPDPAIAPTVSATSGNRVDLQRMCACGGSGDECETCKKKHEEGTLQRKALGTPAKSEAPSIVQEVLRSPGRPLDAATRAFFEPRFSRDFSDVRVHTDRPAAESPRALNASAYAVGSYIVFGSGHYEPLVSTGQQLLAHELVHVVQQGNNNARRHSSHLVQSAPFLRAGLDSPMSQRKLVIQPDGAASDIWFQMDFLCPGNFTLAPGQSPATIVPADPATCAAGGTQSCACLCDVTTDANRTYTIDVHVADLFPDTETLFDGTTTVIPGSDVFPATAVTQNPSITMPASGSGSIEFGAFQSNGSPLWYDTWRILAHELCGHARLNQKTGGKRGDRPGHDVTIDTENAIAAEHGGPARGHYGDKRQGESFFNITGDRSKVVFLQKDGLHFDPP